MGRVIEHGFQRRVRIQAAIPVQVAIDAHAGKAGRQGAAGADVVCRQRLLVAVKTDEAAAFDAQGIHRQAHAARLVQVIEIDQLPERAGQLARIVKARFFRLDGDSCGEKAEGARLEEAGHAAQHRIERGQPDVRAALLVRHQVHVDTVAVRHALPELFQTHEAVFVFVASKNGGIDGADRGAHHPVGRQAMFVQRVVDAGLVGAQCAAALQHQHDAQARGI